MSAITIDLPKNQYEKLQQLADSQNMSVNKLLNNLSVMAISEYEAHKAFEERQRQGDIKAGLTIIQKLKSCQDE